ncbi:S-formylglutathione hydrolase [Pseudohongiella nitratireducens]|uniref:S-formylglutathione hydrolase n=1 Tax=Pseudohongiella nitratireducens TaxID=1768907 RepID=UPI0030EB599B|tara:strand:- start:1607 stop:2491 length:885 start_codon:yes stop_codon:yes gene_type:complete
MSRHSQDNRAQDSQEQPLIEQNRQRLFGGSQIRYQHESSALGCTMLFSVYLPPGACKEQTVPAVYFLSGLTCNDQNFSTKSGAQRVAAELGVALIIPDTSPRGEHVADDEGYDLGQGAGFYVNATEAPWQSNFQMYDYITRELPALVEAHLPVNERRAISGHSMGGHGALMIAARNPERYQSVSAFSPIVHPSACPWGEKAFTAYLGTDKDVWSEYDSVELIKENGWHLPLLVDQGEDDEFLKEQLLTRDLIAVVQDCADVRIRFQSGYDHSYYFIATFIAEHLRFHARHLRAE